MKKRLSKDIQKAKHKGFANRMRDCLEERMPGYSYKEIGKKFKVSDATVAAYINGDKLPKMERVITLCEYFDVNIEWLLAGNGDKYRKKYKKTDQELEEIIGLMHLIEDKEALEIVKNVVGKFASTSS